jgi:hypothetical protein
MGPVLKGGLRPQTGRALRRGDRTGLLAIDADVSAKYAAECATVPP